MEPSKSTFSSFLRNIINDDALENHIPEILNSFSFLELHKNQFLVEKGKVCQYFCFIESGVLQHSIDVFDEEKTTYLALKNSCTAALKSFLQKTPSRKNIK